MASISRDSSDDRSMPDVAALLVSAAAGDQDAWRSIVGLYADRVFGLIRSQCGDAELAEEITQSTFCTVAAKLHEYEEVGRFESWIFRIAMNRLRDEMRRRKRQASPMDEAPLATLAVVPPSAGAAAPTDPAMAELLRIAIASLNDADREIINLRHVGGLSFKQLAETLDEPLGTLLARHHRALRKLREFLEERGFDADGF
jgi:RNA polymerase sigma-70 factor (ECF subfamily)